MRFYCPAPLYTGAKMVLSDEKYHHAKHVLRLADGGDCIAFNGDSGEFKAILHYHKKQAILNIGGNISPPLDKNSFITTWLFCPLFKRDKMGFIIEKAAELGVDNIQPIHMSQVNAAKGRDNFQAEKLTARAISASEQCERLDILTIHPPIDIKKIHNLITDEWCLLTAIERKDSPAMNEILKGVFEKTSKKNIAFLFGPEGGFAGDDVNYLQGIKQNHFCTLGPRILRSETAALYGLSVIACCRDGGP